MISTKEKEEKVGGAERTVEQDPFYKPFMMLRLLTLEEVTAIISVKNQILFMNVTFFLYHIKQNYSMHRLRNNDNYDLGFININLIITNL